jgi:flagellar motor switch protein FliM
MKIAARRILFGGALQLPSVRLTSDEVENLRPGSVLRLNLPSNTIPVWRVGGQPLAYAQVIRLGAHRGVRIERRLRGAEA